MESTNTGLNTELNNTNKRSSDHNYFVLEKTGNTMNNINGFIESNTQPDTAITGVYNEVCGDEENYASIEDDTEDQYNTVDANNVFKMGDTSNNHYDVSRNMLEDYDHIDNGIKTVAEASENDYDKTANVLSLSLTMTAESDPYSHLGTSTDKKDNLENDYDSTKKDVSGSKGSSNYSKVNW